MVNRTTLSGSGAPVSARTRKHDEFPRNSGGFPGKWWALWGGWGACRGEPGAFPGGIGDARWGRSGTRRTTKKCQFDVGIHDVFASSRKRRAGPSRPGLGAWGEPGTRRARPGPGTGSGARSKLTFRSDSPGFQFKLEGGLGAGPTPRGYPPISRKMGGRFRGISGKFREIREILADFRGIPGL